jgi:hypothetical protein
MKKRPRTTERGGGVEQAFVRRKKQRTGLETAARRRVLAELFASHGDLQTLSAKMGRWVGWNDVAQIVAEHTGLPETSASVRNSLMRLRRHGDRRKPRTHNLCTLCGMLKLGHICARVVERAPPRDTLVGASADEFRRNLAASAEHYARRPPYVAWPPLVCLTPAPPAPCRA